MSAPDHTNAASVEPETGVMSIRVECKTDRLAFLPPTIRDPIVAFHAEILGSPAWNWKRVRQEIGYDSSTMSKAFRGVYPGSYERIAAAIAVFFDRQAAEAAPSELVQTPIIKTIWSALDYARANHTGTLIIGPSRTGKTAAAKAYDSRRDEKRLPISIYIQAWPTGGISSIRSALCTKLGIPVKINPSIADAKIVSAISRNRILIIDEAHRLLGSKTGSKSLDYIRAVTDEAGCGFAVLATVRFEDYLLESAYMFEQFIGRIEAPIRIAEEIHGEDWQPIVAQFFPDALNALTADTIRSLGRIANSAGHFASIVHVMHLAQRDAAHRKEMLDNAHVHRAIIWRREKFNQKFFFSQKGRVK